VKLAGSPGRTVGVLLFLQLAGLILPFVLLLPLTTGPRGYLSSAQTASSQVTLAAFLLFANCALTIGISITVFRLLRQYSESVALWLVALGVMMFSAQAVDNIHVLTMVSLSQQYANASGQEELFLALASAAGATRKWAHLSELALIDCWIFLLYSALYRFAVVPRAVAAFGLTTVVLHFMGIPLRGFLGLGPLALMGMPMALSHVTLAIWLVARGFDERHRTLPGERQGA
jgi:hypothetical protein